MNELVKIRGDNIFTDSLVIAEGNNLISSDINITSFLYVLSSLQPVRKG